MAISVDPIRCGTCGNPFQSSDKVMLRLKTCGHLYHTKCLFEGNHIKTTDKMCRVVCPILECKKKIFNVKKENAQEEFGKHIQMVELFKEPTPPPKEVVPPNPEQPKKADPPKEAPVENSLAMAKGLKYVSYIATAITVSMIGLVIHTSLIGVGIGFLASIPVCYFIGKKIEVYLSHKSVKGPS